MSWDEEFGPYYDVPGFLPFLVREKVLEDMSWHNDASPSFGIYSEAQDRDVRFWVDRPFKSHRRGTGSRFAVMVTNLGGVAEFNVDFETDDFEEALERLFQELAALHLNRRPGVLNWHPDTLSDNEWEHPSEYLAELKEKYFADPRN